MFRKCRRLTPSGALLVIAFALLWLPVSFGTATALHATLIARARSLPAWMQLLHPFATLIAKSKLLVLPVYPAAWPQAKQHPIVQRFFQFCRSFMSLDVVQKVRYRYQQTEHGAAVVAASVGRAAARIGLSGWFSAMRVPLTDMLTWIREPWPDVMLRLLETFSGAPLIGPIVNRYFARYEACTRCHRASRCADCSNGGRSSFRPTTMRQRTGRRVETVWVSQDGLWRAQRLLTYGSVGGVYGTSVMKRSLGNFFDTSGSSMMSRRWNRQPMRVTFLIMIAVAIRAGTLMHTKSQSLKFTPSILTMPDKNTFAGPINVQFLNILPSIIVGSLALNSSATTTP